MSDKKYRETLETHRKYISEKIKQRDLIIIEILIKYYAGHNKIPEESSILLELCTEHGINMKEAIEEKRRQIISKRDINIHVDA